MAFLKKKQETPAGGWTYFQTETEFTIKGENLPQLVDLVVRHREYRNLHPKDAASVQQDIERQICTKLGSMECKSEGPADNWVPRDPERNVVTMGMMLGFSKAALAFIASGGQLATMEEAQRRAKICGDCILAQSMTGCSCGTFLKAIQAAVPAERRFGMENKFCVACSCSLSAKINLTEDQVILSNEGRKDIRWPGTPCWQKKIMEQHAADAPAPAQ